ncbi:azurin [Neisseria leonii]|uniref:Azurin n=1 Tax=Neisseria leonii TaxID=2995413 RepID=A0A9X4E2P2_9NEIS|nr:azurin [Neisseria sp. 51.81]MDD9327600.1 azurin [Neisseria sp. 51.81]
MKTYLTLIAAALVLTACSQETPAPAAQESAAPPAASATADTVAAPAADAPAAVCEVVVESDDNMKFNTDEIAIDKAACAEFKITLKHKGKMPVAAMGHNIVISKTEDAAGVVADGAGATADNGYVKPGDSRVIAATKLIGGGEETSIVIDTGKFTAGGAYEFYCTFPGHYGMMRGVVKVS